MSKMRALVTAGVAVAGLVLGAGGSPASASAGDAAAARAEFDRTHLVASVVLTVSTPKRVSPPASLAAPPTTAACWTARANGSARAAAGNTLYTFYTVGGWCASGSTVTSSWFADAGGETSTPGWRYEGVINRASGVVSNQGRTYSQHRFVLGAGGWDIQSPTPCLRVEGRANATATASYTCGIY